MNEATLHSPFIPMNDKRILFIRRLATATREEPLMGHLAWINAYAMLFQLIIVLV